MGWVVPGVAESPLQTACSPRRFWVCRRFPTGCTRGRPPAPPKNRSFSRNMWPGSVESSRSSVVDFDEPHAGAVSPVPLVRAMATRPLQTRRVLWLGVAVWAMALVGRASASCGDYVHVAGGHSDHLATKFEELDPLPTGSLPPIAKDWFNSPRDGSTPAAPLPCHGPQCRQERRNPAVPPLKISSPSAGSDALPTSTVQVSPPGPTPSDLGSPALGFEPPPAERRERPPRVAA